MLSKQRPRLVNPTFIFDAESAEHAELYSNLPLVDKHSVATTRLGRDYYFLKNLTLRQAQGRLCHATRGGVSPKLGGVIQSRFLIL